MEIKKKVIGYIRVSTEEQAKDGFSLDNQIEDIREKCKKEEWELIDILEDKGISGASLNKRDGLKKVLKLIKENKANCLMVWKLSRLSRSVSNASDIADFLESKKAHLISIQDGIDTSTPMGKYFLYFASIFAQMERESIIVQVKGGMAQKAREGQWNGGPTPLGYDLKDKKLVINKESSELVKFIFTEYLKGNGYKAVARTLNEKGFKSSKDSEFSGNSIKGILTNPLYAGKIRWGNLKDWGKKDENGQRQRQYNEDMILVDGIHEAIVNSEMFDKAQKMIEDNPRHHVKQFNGEHILSGILRCPDCGYGMSIQVVKSKGKTYEYYSCNQYANKKTCKPNLISKNAIEEEFFQIFEKIVNDEDFKSRILSALNNSSEQVVELEKAISRKEKDTKELEKEKVTLREELKHGSADFKQMIRDDIEETLKKIKVVQSDIDALLLNINIVKSRTINLNEISEILQSVGKVLKLMDKPTQRRLISKLIKEIKTDEKHIKEICFSFEEGFRVERGTLNHIISNCGL